MIKHFPTEVPSQPTYSRLLVDELDTFAGNPRRGAVEAIASSLNKHGQYRPIVVNAGTKTGRRNEVLAGNHTLLAARQLGWLHVDAAIIDVDDNTARSIVAADNRLADLGDYDDTALYELLSSLDDLDGTGYTNGELEALGAALNPPVGNGDPDDAPPTPAEPISQTGQIWTLGPHRLLVGDCTDLEAMRALAGDTAPECVWTDPPYGVDYCANMTPEQARKARKRTDGLTIQNDGAAGLEALLDGAFSVIAAVCQPGAPVYVAHADTERVAFETAMLGAGLIVRQNLVWVKDRLALGRSDYHYQHEPILYGFTPGGLGRLGRGGDRWYGDNSQTTVFEFDKPARSAEHPTMKPVELIQAMLKNSLRPGGTVLDPFAGSGSTLMAAHGFGGRALCAELDPCYADVILRRFEMHTGIAPCLNGKTVSFLEEVAA